MMAAVRINSRAELEQYLREHPLQLKAGRILEPRPGHPDFIGPFRRHVVSERRPIEFSANDGASFTIQKAAWEKARDEKILRFLGEL